MAVSHVFSSPIADFTGTVTVYNSAGSTVTAAASEIVRPSNWNSVHNQIVTLAGNTAGISTLSGTNIVIQGGPNATVSGIQGVDQATIAFSGGAGAAGNTGFISAGAATASLGTVVFADSNGVSFGINAQTLTASHNGLTSQSNQAVSAANGSVAFQTVSFSNANGVSFATAAGPAIVASVAAQSVQPGIQSISGGTTRATTGEVVFSNSNGVSFGVDGNTVTASHNGLTSQSNQAVSAANGSVAFQTVSFSNANGISFVTAAGPAIVASHNALTSQSNQAVSADNGSYAFQTLSFSNANGVSFGTSAGSAVTASIATSLSNIRVSGGTTSNLLSAITFADANGVSFGLDGSTLTASVAPGGGGLTNINVSAGTTSNLLSAITFANGNGISFGLDASTVTASHNALTSQSNQNVTAGNGGFAFQTLSFSNANGVSFGTSAGSAITGSVAAQTNQTVGLYALGNTTQNSSTTLDARTVSLNGLGGITVGYSNGSVQISGPQTVAQSVQTIGGYAVSNTTGQSSSSTLDARSISFHGAGIASVGYSGGSVVISVPAGGGAGDGGVFAGVSTGGNTAGSTGTVSTGNVVFVGSGPISLSQSTGAAGSAATISIIGPATSSLVADNGISLSTNGSTITVMANPLSRSVIGEIVSQAGNAHAASLVSVVPFIMDWPVAFSNVRCGASISLATVANNSSAYMDISYSGVLYSRNASTLSSILSGSTTLTASYSSNNAASNSINGAVALDFTVAATTLPPGEYWWAFHFSSAASATGGANTTSLGKTVSMLVGGINGSAAMSLRPFGSNSNATLGAHLGQGIISTGATLASIPFSSITHTGTRGVAAEVFVEMRNYTI